MCSKEEHVLKKVMIIRSGECCDEKVKLSGVGIRQMKFLLNYPLEKYIKEEGMVVLICSDDPCSKESAKIISNGLKIEYEVTSILLDNNNYDDTAGDSIVLSYIKEQVVKKDVDIVVIIISYVEFSNLLSKEVIRDMDQKFCMPSLKKGGMIIIDSGRKFLPEIY